MATVFRFEKVLQTLLNVPIKGRKDHFLPFHGPRSAPRRHHTSPTRNWLGRSCCAPADQCDPWPGSPSRPRETCGYAAFAVADTTTSILLIDPFSNLRGLNDKLDCTSLIYWWKSNMKESTYRICREKCPLRNKRPPQTMIFQRGE